VVARLDRVLTKLTVANLVAAGVLLRASAALALLAGLLACESAVARAPESEPTVADSDSAERARQDSVNRAQPGYVVDSALSVEEELRRFRDAIGGEAVTEFTGGSGSIDSLVARFVAAVERSDTVEFRRLAVSAREFADLIYRTSPFARPPYRQAPGFVWFQTQNASSAGLTGLLTRHGGRPFEIVAYTCAAPPEVQSANRIWTGCSAQIRRDDGSTRYERMFAAIVERGGRFKVLSYANDL